MVLFSVGIVQSAAPRVQEVTLVPPSPGVDELAVTSEQKFKGKIGHSEFSPQLAAAAATNSIRLVSVLSASSPPPLPLPPPFEKCSLASLISKFVSSEVQIPIDKTKQKAITATAAAEEEDDFDRCSKSQSRAELLSSAHQRRLQLTAPVHSNMAPPAGKVRL